MLICSRIYVETVEEFTRQVEEIAGLESGQQSVLFRGKLLSATDSFEDLGIQNGDVLNVVKGSRKARTARTVSDADIPAPGGSDKLNAVDREGLQKAMAQASPEDIQNTMAAMDKLLDSDFIDEYFGDDERLENARIQMLQNVDQYDQMMPGFKDQAREIASDPEKWKEAMQNAREQILQLKAQRDKMRGGQGQPKANIQPQSSPQDDSVDDIIDDQ
jgi:Ubiquitin family